MFPATSVLFAGEKDDSPMYGYLSSLLQSIREAGKRQTAILKRKWKNIAPICREMTAEALRIFEKASLNMAWYNRLVENREVIAEQLDAMAYIMEDCAKKQKKNITEECRSNLQDIAYRSKERGIKVIDEQLWEKENGRWQLVMKVMVKMAVSLREN